MPAQTLCNFSCCWLIFMIYVLRTLIFRIVFALCYLLFPLFFSPLLNTCIHSGCWDSFITLMTICLTLFTSCIIAFHFGVEVRGQLDLLSTTHYLARTVSIFSVSWPGSARLWMLFVAVNVFASTLPHFFSFFFLSFFLLFIFFLLSFSPSLFLYLALSPSCTFPVIQPPRKQNHGRLV